MIRPNRAESVWGIVDPPVGVDSPGRRLRLLLIGSPSPRPHSFGLLSMVVRNLASEPTDLTGSLRGPGRAPAIAYTQWLFGLWEQVRRSEAILVGLDSQFAIISRLLPALLAARWYGRPLIVLIDLPTPDRRLPMIIRLSRTVLRMVDHLVVPTEWEAVALRRLGVAGIVIPPVVECAPGRQIQKVQPHLQVNIDRGCVHELEQIYRAFTIVRQKYPRAELTITTYGGSQKSVESFVNSSGIGSDHGVHFRIDVSADIPSTGDITICVDTSAAYPRNLVMAWRSGTPALVPAYSMVSSLIRDHHNGLIYSTHGAGTLADAIIELVENPSMVQQLSGQGLRESMAFEWTALRARWWSILTPPNM